MALRSANLADFGIVIPHLDFSDRLEACLLSVIYQEGDFSLEIHVQDGGQTNIAEKIVSQVRESTNRPGLSITYSREPDSGAAEAINRGMMRVNAEMLTWLGADDILFPGALESVYSLRHEYPEVKWITGLPHLISERGVGLPAHGTAAFYRNPGGFSRTALQLGLHAGEANHGFVQQEGTFWHRTLWEKVGGLDTSLSLAFDFDLWCRMANESDLVEIAAPLGAFRKRKGQASADLGAYRAQVKAIRQGLSRSQPDHRKLLLVDQASVALWDINLSKWNLNTKAFKIVLPARQHVWAIYSIRHLRYLFVTFLRKVSRVRPTVRLALLLVSLSKAKLRRSLGS